MTFFEPRTTLTNRCERFSELRTKLTHRGERFFESRTTLTNRGALEARLCCGGGVNAIAMLFANTLTHAVGGIEQFLAGLSARG